jgi:mono/diheme cytochrome c family protein
VPWPRPDRNALLVPERRWLLNGSLRGCRQRYSYHLARRKKRRKPTAPGMPAYGRLLDDEQVAAVLTYMRNIWGPPAPAVSPSEVSKPRSSLAARPD